VEEVSEAELSLQWIYSSQVKMGNSYKVQPEAPKFGRASLHVVI
jgi:hypothetical protein